MLPSQWSILSSWYCWSCRSDTVVWRSVCVISCTGCHSLSGWRSNYAQWPTNAYAVQLCHIWSILCTPCGYCYCVTPCARLRSASSGRMLTSSTSMALFLLYTLVLLFGIFYWVPATVTATLITVYVHDTFLFSSGWLQHCGAFVCVFTSICAFNCCLIIIIIIIIIIIAYWNLMCFDSLSISL